MRSIYYGNDHILSYTDFNQPDLHKHWAKHIAVGLDNQIKVVVGNNKIHCDGIIINSNVLHTISCNYQKHLVFSFEEASNIACEIQSKYLPKSDFCLLDQSIVEAIRREFHMPDPRNITADYHNTYNNILALLGLKLNNCTISDERIIQALELIKAKGEIDNNIFKEIIELINISQSRFSHLFKEQVGIPLNSYLVMIKLIKAYKYLFDGRNITNAALMAGFNSASHFAATSKDMIGLSAKNISHNCKIIEV